MRSCTRSRWTISPSRFRSSGPSTRSSTVQIPAGTGGSAAAPGSAGATGSVVGTSGTVIAEVRGHPALLERVRSASSPDAGPAERRRAGCRADRPGSSRGSLSTTRSSSMIRPSSSSRRGARLRLRMSQIRVGLLASSGVALRRARQRADGRGERLTDDLRAPSPSARCRRPRRGRRAAFRSDDDLGHDEAAGSSVPAAAAPAAVDDAGAQLRVAVAGESCKDGSHQRGDE